MTKRVIVSSLGHVCGYVAVPPGHPLHGVDYREIAEMPGLTFSGRLNNGGDNWWLGIDTMGMRARYEKQDAHVRATLERMEKEVSEWKNSG